MIMCFRIAIFENENQPMLLRLLMLVVNNIKVVNDLNGNAGQIG